MQINIELLKDEMNKCSMNIKKVAALIGIDESTFYRKLKANGETFTVKEMFDIIEVLDIEKEKASEIFLVTNLHKCEK